MTEAILEGWVGGYTGSSSPDGGIGRLRWDERGLRVTATIESADPSYLALSPDGTRLYAVHESAQGSVSAYAVDGDRLRHLGSQPTGGDSPCHLLVHPSADWLLVANYGSGSVSLHPLGPEGAVLPASDLVQHVGAGPVPGRQDGPHAHQVAVDPGGEWLFAVDLGADTVVTYRLDLRGGRLVETALLALPPGTGPRHVALHPSGHAAYVVGELSSTLTTCRHQNGVLTAVHTTSVRPAGASGENAPAAVVVSPDGKRVMVTNRGDDTVATLALNGGGLLARLVDTATSGGRGPRDLTVSSNGTSALAANERDGQLVGFDVTADGVQARVSAPWPAPTCVVLDRPRAAREPRGPA